MKKGVSTVIATILMLIITIALAGVAYMYMSGVLTGKTAVLLAEAGDPQCIPGQAAGSLVFWVRNDGQTASGTLVFSNVPTNPTTSQVSNCISDITTLTPGNVTMVICNRGAAGMGYWQVRVTAPGTNTLTERVYCPS
jgi:flagellin-like protein